MSKPYRLESSIERAAVAKAKTLGWANVKISGRFSQGYPDRLFWKHGRYVWIEFKGPKGKVTPLQSAMIERLRFQGCYVAVCNSVESCITALQGSYSG